MDINQIYQMIGSLGFPIVACAALFWQSYDERRKHAEESAKLAEAVNNNTEALTKLIDHFNAGD